MERIKHKEKEKEKEEEALVASRETRGSYSRCLKHNALAR